MQRVKFTYTIPMIGEYENDGPLMTLDEIVKVLEQTYPEATEIEIFEETTSV